MPEVDSQRREEGDEVDDEEPLFPAVGLAILENRLSGHSAACWVYTGGLPSETQFLEVGTPYLHPHWLPRWSWMGEFTAGAAKMMSSWGLGDN